jgi:hypothetical protein
MGGAAYAFQIKGVGEGLGGREEEGEQGNNSFALLN